MTSFDPPANACDFATVCVCFENGLISALFADLLEGRGVKTRVLTDIAECRGEARIITESQYYPLLPTSCRDTCLVVGNREVLKGITALTLAQPLTEEKIEEALSRFLGEGGK